VDSVAINKTDPLSDKINLYQALQVIAEEESSKELKSEVEADSICLTPVKVTLIMGML